MLNVVEKFVSINGEGAHAGELSAFIRFKGCNLSCSYCDTKWANCKDTEAKHMSPQELSEWVMQQRVINVTLTGGEPLLQKGIEELIELLAGNGIRVEIETNGSIPLEKFAALKHRPVFTMDYKLPSSGMEKFMYTDNFSLLKKSDTVKMVAGSSTDLVFGHIEPSDMVEFMIKHHLNKVRLQLQLHKFIWEPERRGV